MTMLVDNVLELLGEVEVKTGSKVRFTNGVNAGSMGTVIQVQDDGSYVINMDGKNVVAKQADIEMQEEGDEPDMSLGDEPSGEPEPEQPSEEPTEPEEEPSEEPEEEEPKYPETPEEGFEWASKSIERARDIIGYLKGSLGGELESALEEIQTQLDQALSSVESTISQYEGGSGEEPEEEPTEPEEEPEEQEK